MASDASVALTALIIVGLVALTVATGQFMQQIFGTADGYRRCQRAVIGAMVKKDVPRLALNRVPLRDQVHHARDPPLR